MTKHEIIDIVYDFHKFLLKNYEGITMDSALPQAVQEYKILHPESSEILNLHENLDRNLCIVKAVIKKIDEIRAT